MIFSMQDFLSFLYQKIWTIIISVLSFTVISLIGTYFLTSPTYNVSFSLYIYNTNDRTDNTSITISDLTASHELANTYTAILTSNKLLGDVAETLPQYALTTTRLKESISTSSVNNSELLKVTVTDSDPDIAIDISQTLQKLAPNFIIQVVKVGSVEVLDSANTATPTNRPLVKNAILGGGIGLVIAIGTLLAFFLLDTRVWDEVSLTNRFKLPVLGIIPDAFDDIEITSPDDLLLSSNMTFAVSEAYRAARINILKQPSEKKCNVYAFTSSKPEEGKTISAINMAISLAQNGSSVLLVDMDFRKPQVRNYLHLKDNPSFMDYVTRKIDYLDILQFDDLPLHVLATSIASSYPSEILATERVSQMFQEFSNVFDFIIIDTPPLEYVIDAAVLSDIVDGYLHVVKAGFSRLGQIESSIRKMEQIDANVIGFFLRNVDPKMCGLGSRYHIYSYNEKYEPYYR